jgi:hypothetical protein
MRVAVVAAFGIGASALSSARGMTTMSAALSNKASFAAGCYWGTQKYLEKDFNKLIPGGVKSGAVGT